MGGAGGQRAAASGIAPALLVRSAAEAVFALSHAGRPVLLLSAPGAAGSLGPGGWRALVARATAASPGSAFEDAICCGDAPGHALAALRAGCRLLVLDRASPAFHAVEAAAAEIGARLLPARPPALDLGTLDLRRDGARVPLARWLAAHPHDSEAIKR